MTWYVDMHDTPLPVHRTIAIDNKVPLPKVDGPPIMLQMVMQPASVAVQLCCAGLEHGFTVPSAAKRARVTAPRSDEDVSCLGVRELPVT